MNYFGLIFRGSFNKRVDQHFFTKWTELKVDVGKGNIGQPVWYSSQAGKKEEISPPFPISESDERVDELQNIHC